MNDFRLVSSLTIVAWITVGFCGGSPSIAAPPAPTVSTGASYPSPGGDAARMPIGLTAARLDARQAGEGKAEAPVIAPEKLAAHLPPPERAEQVLLADLARDKSPNAANKIRNALERIGVIRRDKQIRLSLDDVIRRMLTNSYRIQETSYNPAVGTAALVQAQAEFDAAFFASMTRAKTDQPTGNQLVTAGSDFFLLATGVEKRLPMGMSIRGQYEIRRIKQTLAFQTLNPEYRSQFALSMRQPLLRGFGIDYNRSLIVIAENRRGIDDLTLRSQVELRLREIEQLYWNLVQARRNFVIGAREVADFEAIYAYLEARKDFDVLPVSLFTTKATLKVAEAGFVRDRSRVFDAQDRLIAAMNDPDINLIDNVELIPVDFPSIERFDIDRLAEVQAALDHRTDIQAQRLAVDIQKIEVARAKNEELPQLDLTFQVTATGLSGNADRSFDEVTRGNFLSYDFVLEFRLPIGNRSARARRRQQDLGHAQATAKLRWTIEDAIRDVNLAMRELQTSYDQLAPGFDSLEARQREVNSQVARAERKDYPTLSTELAAWRALARTRADILALMVAYRNAIIDLEWKKGTLLSFNNVVIQPAGADDR